MISSLKFWISDVSGNHRGPTEHYEGASKGSPVYRDVTIPRSCAAAADKQMQTKSKSSEGVLYITQILQGLRVAGRLYCRERLLGRCAVFTSRSTHKPQAIQKCIQCNTAHPFTSSWHACRVISPIFLPHPTKKVFWSWYTTDSQLSSVKPALCSWLLKCTKAM